MKCRHCSAELGRVFIDLGETPPSNAYLSEAMLDKPEKYYPLKVMVCEQCWLVQTEDFVGAAEMFSAEYAYFSSFSKSWVQHAKQYVEKMVERFKLNKDSCVIEIAANDGYLLQFVKELGIPCYGIEPTSSTAQAAREKGIEIIESFFGIQLADDLVKSGRKADLIAANNVLAHVPDINDFVAGFSLLLKEQGVATFEFPHLLNLVNLNQFDTIYHEHYSYLSLTAVKTIFEANGLSIFDVEKLETHGGSLRVYAQKADTGEYEVSKNVLNLLMVEKESGVSTIEFYDGFQNRADQIRTDLLSFLQGESNQGKKIIAYGAAAKGNTMLNYAGVSTDLVSYVVDKNPAKKDHYMPGSRIPIVDETKIVQDKPDWILILPWNLKSEVIEQLSYIKDWGGRFVLAVPKLEVQ